jgi:hypothetical protein
MCKSNVTYSRCNCYTNHSGACKEVTTEFHTHVQLITVIGSNTHCIKELTFDKGRLRVYNTATKLNIGVRSMWTITDGHLKVWRCAYIRVSVTSQFNQKKQHTAVTTLAPPVITEETFLKLTVTVRMWTTFLLSPFSPVCDANSKKNII